MANGTDASMQRRFSILAAVGRPFLPAIGRAGSDMSDPDVVFRTQILVLHATLTSVFSLSYAYSHLQSGAIALAGLFVSFAAAVVALLVALRIIGTIRLVAHGTVLVGTAFTIIATYFTGGLRLTNICPFFIVIISSIFLLGWEGMGWAALAVLAPLSFELASRSGFSFPDHVPPESRSTDAFMTWAVAVVVVWAFVVCYEAARVYSLRRREEAEAVRSQFLANVSHELRTPLHAIMGMNRSTLRNDLPSQVRAALETSQRSAETLLVLINDLLDLASIERHRFVLKVQDFDPVGVVEQVASVLRVRCKEEDLDFTLAVDPTVPRWVRGDDNRLQQVLMNLGSNAIKYTERGAIEVSVSPVAKEGNALACRFSVADSGIGIADLDRERIFGQFVQLDGSLSRAHEGVGLGLFIAQEIVTAMKGRIELESAVGEGSSFHVIVPFEPPEAARAEPIEPLVGDAVLPAGARALLVDDNEVNLEMAKLMLEELCEQVWVARDGHQAIDTWAAEQPDVIVMDLQMPGMDGLEAIGRIRKREQAQGRRPVAILALTGHGTKHHRQQSQSAGADACLFKPFRFEELADAIAAIVDHDNRYNRDRDSRTNES